MLAESLRDKNQEAVKQERQVMFVIYAGAWLASMVMGGLYVLFFATPDAFFAISASLAPLMVVTALPLRSPERSRYLYLPGLWLLAATTFYGSVHYDQPVIAMFALTPAFFMAVFYWYDRWLTVANIIGLTTLTFLAPLLSDIEEPLRTAMMMAPTFATLAVALGHLGACANRLNVERERFDSTISSLLVALHERDGESDQESSQVENIASLVAERLGLCGDQLRLVVDSARLHDVGKIGIPSELLDKPASLTADEWRVMRTHPEIGERIVATVPGFDDVAIIVRHTHERWDGNGYPDRLAGDDIPLASRVIFACDAYEAMTSPRPFRPASSHDEACRELRRGAGTQFDPAVVSALIDVLGSRHGQDFGAGGVVVPLHRIAAA